MIEHKRSTAAYNAAIALLTRREHSVYELTQKLAKYGVDEALEAILKCQELDLQSDLRFAEMLCRTRVNQGYGPHKIAKDLLSARVDRDLIAQVIAAENLNWVDHALRVWQKKYRNVINNSLLEQQKQQKFLLTRGFTHETITRVMKLINVAIT
jgi:regulatory protein